MKNGIKISTITAVVFIGIGLCMSTAGVILGANKKISLDENGIHMGESNPYNYTSGEIKDIKNIIVSVDNAKVEILPSDGDYYQIEINMADEVNVPEINITDSKITVKQKVINYMFNIDFEFFKSSDVVKIYVPADSKLNLLDLESSNGEIDIKNSFEVNKLRISTSNGKVDAGEIVCNEGAVIKTSNGSIKCSGIFKKSAEMKTSNGKINISGKFYGEISCKTSNGAIEADISDAIEKYNIKADTSNGNISINDKKVEDNYILDNSADNQIKFKTSNGSIDIDFK